MAVTDAQNPLVGEATCGTLLQKLQVFHFLIVQVYDRKKS
jgi:hypothetical protein